MKQANRERFYELNRIKRIVGQEASRNFEGNYSYKELKNSIKTFNFSTPLETRTRISRLRALFSAKLMGKVSVTGKGDYVPETTPAFGQALLGDEKESEAFFSKRRIWVSDQFIVGYYPPTEDSQRSNSPKSRWNRAWQIHVQYIRSLAIKKEENDKCALFINL